jgi:integrase
LEAAMAFMMDTEEIKPGVVIFRRADVDHENWYCRMRLPKQDRYKTISLKTPYIEDARRMAGEQEIELRVAIKHDMPLFNRPFRQIAKDFLAEEELRAKAGQITYERVKRMRSVIESKLNAYVGSIQINLIGSDRWENYPNWRRAYGEGRMARPGFVRERTDDEVVLSKERAEAADKARAKAKRDKVRGNKFPKVNATAKGKDEPWIIVSDATIGFEMSIFGAVMSYAQRKRYVSADKRFEGRLNLKKLRRDEFTLEEYRRLHTKARKWRDEASDARSRWYRETAYNFMLIMCNTGMRPSEARNLRWRDITRAKDRDGRELVVLSVSGKGKSRKLVAPVVQNAGEYLERIRACGAATGPNDFVFTTSTGKTTRSLYKHLIDEMLDYAELRDGPQGIPRSTYCFRHTYATLRLSEGVDVYFLAEQMGTSVKMIEEHYGHVNTIKHADRVLQGIGNWNPVAPAQDAEAADAEKPKAKKAARNKRARVKAGSVKEADAKAARALAIRRKDAKPH